MELMMGDKIIIYSLDKVEGMVQNLVQIDGYVKSPGEYDLVEEMKVYDLLEFTANIRGIKGKNFRVSHMGDINMEDVNEIIEVMDQTLEEI